MTQKFVTCTISIVLITLAFLVVCNQPVSAATPIENQTMNQLQLHSLKDDSKDASSEPYFFKSNAVEHKHPIYQTTSKSTLPETGKSISHSPVMAGIIALVLGLVILIHKKISARK